MCLSKKIMSPFFFFKKKEAWTPIEKENRMPSNQVPKIREEKEAEAEEEEEEEEETV